MSSCLICNSGDTELYITVKSNKYFKCKQCTCVFLPSSTATGQLEFHSEREYKLNRLHREIKAGEHRLWLIELMKSYNPNGRMLEIGCSTGFFLKAASDAGYEVIGIDLGDENVMFGKYFLGVKILNEDFLRFDEEKPMDWIVMEQLIEHVVNPMEFIRKAKSLLNSNGHLLITTPNLDFAESLIKWPKKFAMRPVFKDAFGHSNHCVLFRPDALKKLLTQEGFNVLAVGHNPSGFISRRRYRHIIERILPRLMPNWIGPNFYIIAKVS
jgi:2-polyprenyl-3-methyl-5-hydroxy-6-metoxy-1,4-benzoquinol methylase